jgi:short-subunit dehydrogenase
MKELRGRNAILTGASRGLGSHLARALAREGVNLALAARSADALERVRNDVRTDGVTAVAVPTDLADTAQVARLARTAEAELGPIDILINNAGVEHTAPYQDQPVDDIEAAVGVNLLAAMLLTRAVLPGMIERGRGHVVNMSSLAGKIGLPLGTPYGTTKAALVMFTHCLRAELVGSPVGASVVCPGFVAGDGMYDRLEAEVGPAPPLSKPTTIARVTAAVMRAIRRDRAEVIVNPLPVRPATVLREILPGTTPYLHRLLGTAGYARKLLDARSARPESPGDGPAE